MELNLITDCDDLNLDFSGWRGFTLDFFEQEETSLDFNLRVRPVVGFCPEITQSWYIIISFQYLTGSKE